MSPIANYCKGENLGVFICFRPYYVRHIMLCCIVLYNTTRHVVLYCILFVDRSLLTQNEQI